MTLDTSAASLTVMLTLAISLGLLNRLDGINFIPAIIAKTGHFARDFLQ
jgi:hypothetical protein